VSTAEVTEPQKVHKKPRVSRTVLGGSLANPEFANVFNAPQNADVEEDAETAQVEPVETKARHAQWQDLLKKDKLTPLEMMQEAAFTELINKQSLE